MQTWHKGTVEAAKGKWRGILINLGIPDKHLNGKNAPCPLCGGKDRFMYDNKGGAGTYICRQCGAGYGIQLAMAFTNKPFHIIAKEIDAMLGNGAFKTDAPKPDLSDQQRAAALREVAALTTKIKKGDLADIYLTSRGVGEATYFKTLRFAPKLKDGDGAIRPCLVATVQGPDGANVTLHRTFLANDGMGKAQMNSPRKLMPGSLPQGSAIRLSDYHGEGPLGIAEGIETALSASSIFEMPVWAAINAQNMAKWAPPEGCQDVAIFADHDLTFAGQAAGYQLANRLTLAGIAVTIHIPPTPGHDWNDELLARAA